MKFFSLFSGIEGASVAWNPLGWECVGVSEIDPFACAVLAHHYPEVPNLGDVTKITEQDIAALGHIDVVVFGSPCTDLSVAGQRRGLKNADGTITRSGLFFNAINIFQWATKHCGARFALWENVPGAYSSNAGRDFASVVETMAGLDYVGVPVNGWGTEGCAVGDNGLLEWSCLDAEWFGLAQRRRRVFAVLDTGDWTNRPPILLERKSLRGDSPPRREAGEDVAGTLASRTSGGGGCGTDPVYCLAHGQGGAKLGIDRSPTLTCNHEAPIAAYSTSGAGYWRDGIGALRARPQDSHENIVLSVALRGRDGGATAELGGPVAGTLRASDGGGDKAYVLAPVADTLTAGWHRSNGATAGNNSGMINPVIQNMAVRRLMPSETEILQGFPRGYTQILYHGKPAADGNRYKAIGNSFAVPVLHWIGQKIQVAVDHA